MKLRNFTLFSPEYKIQNGLIIGIMLLVGFAVRLWGYSTNPIAMDEPFTIFHSQKPIGELLNLFKSENNPPLFFLMSHFWIELFGIEVTGVRVLPVLLSSVTIPITYMVINRHFGQLTAGAVSSMLLLSNLQQFHAHNFRAYALFVLLSIWSLHHFLSMIESDKRMIHVIGLSVSGLLLLYNHFLGSVVLGSYGLVSICVPEVRKNVLSPMIISGITITAGFAPYLSILFERFAKSGTDAASSWVPVPGLGSLYNLLWSFCNQPVIVVSCLAAISLGLVVSFVKNHPISLKEKVVFSLFLIPYFGMFAISQRYPMFIDRYLIFAAAPFYISVIQLAKRLGVGIVPKAAIGFIVLGFLFSFNPYAGHRDQERILVERIKRLKLGTHAVLVNPSWYDLNFAYHFDKDIFRDYQNLHGRLNQANVFPVGSVEELPIFLADSFQKAYHITPVNNQSEYVQKFRREIKAIYPTQRIDTTAYSNMLMVYSK